MVEVQETVKKSSETVKESWNRPEFEVIGVEKTENLLSPGDDGAGTSTLS
ncbi:MAG: hypothetical protein M0P91_03915 [Sulfuricurvum sp.]|jgi:hypothetical protein|nr:hypothetical protein [Sulfuricurvum sp.]MCK9372318.1 hypothetical protein [Sulfuricurvum sp.]